LTTPMRLGWELAPPGPLLGRHLSLSKTAGVDRRSSPQVLVTHDAPMFRWSRWCLHGPKWQAASPSPTHASSLALLCWIPAWPRSTASSLSATDIQFLQVNLLFSHLLNFNIQHSLDPICRQDGLFLCFRPRDNVF
jgi:hypothetical protein